MLLSCGYSKRLTTVLMSPAPNASRTPPPDLLARASVRLLRPLVRLLIRGGVTFPVLAELLRGLYVEVALTELLTDPRARTDSRVSLLTGVHRKEVRRQRAPDPEDAPAVVTLASQIIARWLGTPAYADAAGAPRPLPRTAPDGASFEALVAAVTRDVRPRAVLDDWIAQNIVSLDADGRVRLNEAAFIPRRGGEEQMFFFARNLHDHVAAACANVGAAGPAPFLDRSVHYDRLGPDAAAKLEAAGREAAQRMLLDVNRTALALVEAEEADGTSPASAAAARRVNLGVFLYAEDEPPLPARNDAE